MTLILRHLVRQVVVLAGILLPAFVAAQAPIEPPLINPGARSLGLGGAFVAVADDATAASANPSGLVQLVRSELSAELRAWSDDRQGVASNLSGVGFASFVLPRERWSLAVYGQTLASLDFADDASGGGGDFVPLSSVSIANAGVSAALRLNDAVSLGLGLALFAGNATEVGVDYSSVPVPYSRDETNFEPGVVVGGLWNLGDAWAVGASYRSGCDFRFASGRQVVLPDILAAGGRWRSHAGHATVAFEVERLSGLEDRLRLHLGGEWVFLSVKPLVGLRVGLWHDPEGGSASVGFDGALSRSDGVMHASTGIGVALRRFQIDLGVDVSERTTIASLSAIFTF
jgi:long-subunit fatty acid transport protein